MSFVRRIAGLHCEQCGRPDPSVDDDGYTTCCNELQCWGDTSVEWAFEFMDENFHFTPIDAPHVWSCCGASAGPMPEGANSSYQVPR